MTGRSITALRAKCFPYAYWTDATDPETGQAVPGVGSHRFFVFRRPARIRAWELDRSGRAWGGLPDRVVIEAYTTPEPRGTVIHDGPLPWKQGKARIEFPDVPAIAVSQRCHGRTGVLEHFMEWSPSAYTVPFNVFDRTTWFGTAAPELTVPEPPAPAALVQGRLAPRSGDGVRAWTDGLFVHYRSRFLQIAFSLVRPRISFLAWDGLGTGRVEKNFLVDAPAGFDACPTSGPWRRHLGFELPSMLWTGAVEVNGRRVRYHGLRSLPGFSMDVEFAVSATGFSMRIAQEQARAQTFLEAEAWRLVWDGRRVFSLATLARPQRGAHRNGLVEARGGWHASGQGTLTFAPVGPPPVGIQIDTAGWEARQVFAGVLLGCRPEPFGPVTLLAGRHTTKLDFRVTNLEVRTRAGTRRRSLHSGLRRAWGSTFAFRPEHGGFSNNSFSINAENCLYQVADVAPYTVTREPLPSMMDLLRYTLELAVKGGPGYACFLNEAHDTAPAQLITAGRIYQVQRDPIWVRALWPFLERRIRHVLGNRNADGFYVCHRLSGNSGSYHTSCNAWDTFCFGHADGYSGALAYRGLRNAVVLARAAGQPGLAEECTAAAQRMRAAFVPTLFNPATGWLAGWRSADGMLHDHALQFVTALAAIYGILDAEQAQNMIGRLEQKRVAAGLTDFRFGLAPQFAPVPAADHWADSGWVRKEVPHRADGADTYGIFTNGGITPGFTGPYLAALSRFGFKKTADRICDQLLDSFDRGTFEGCLNGAECFAADGTPSGYEGTLAHIYHVLLAIAQHKGWVAPLQPEWWPADG